MYCSPWASAHSIPPCLTFMLLELSVASLDGLFPFESLS